MDAEATVSVSAAVVAFVSLIKWAGVSDKLGPIAVMVASLLGVVLWGYSEGTYERTKLFEYFVGWIAVTTGAAGIFGFTRASSSAVTSMKAPPAGGAGSNLTMKDNE